MLRTALLAAAQSDRCRAVAADMPLTRQLVSRFVAGTEVAHAIATASTLAVDREVTLDHLGESTVDAEQAVATVDAYTQLLHLLDHTGLTSRVEISVKLSAIGGALAKDGKKIALANARRICEAAHAVGTTVTVDMEDHTTTDQTLETVRELRVDFPWVGAVLQAYLRRTEQDCRELSGQGSRVRLCKGAYREPPSVAYQRKSEVDLAYVRCLRILMAGKGYPMVATHDPGWSRSPRSWRATVPSSTRCSTGSDRGNRTGSPRGAVGCVSTSPMATSGTRTSCAASPNVRRTSPSSSAPSRRSTDGTHTMWVSGRSPAFEANRCALSGRTSTNGSRPR